MSGQGILFQPMDKRCPIEGAESVLDVALKNGIDLGHSCGGMGSCTTCRICVEFSPQALPPRTDLEQDIAEMRSFQDEERLACQLPPSEGLVVRIPTVFTDESST